MKIPLDINLTPPWREPLERLGHEVRHWSEIGDASASDAIIMEYARRNDFVVFTNDLEIRAGALVTVDPRKDRVSILPIRRK